LLLLLLLIIIIVPEIKCCQSVQVPHQCVVDSVMRKMYQKGSPDYYYYYYYTVFMPLLNVIILTHFFEKFKYWLKRKINKKDTHTQQKHDTNLFTCYIHYIILCIMFYVLNNKKKEIMLYLFFYFIWYDVLCTHCHWLWMKELLVIFFSPNVTDYFLMYYIIWWDCFIIMYIYVHVYFCKMQMYKRVDFWSLYHL